MYPAADPDPPFVARAVASAIRAGDHRTTAWIVGISVAVFAGPSVGMLCVALAPYGTEPTFPYGARWGVVLAAVTVAAVALLVIELTRRANATIARNVRRALVEGTRHQGTIVQARRVSMTQAKVIVQGATFAPFERMLSTSLPDAELLSKVVDVYKHPELGELLLLPEV
jgi:hypothetical protein